MNNSEWDSIRDSIPDYEEGIANAFRYYGQIYVYQGNWPAALGNYLEALAIYEKLEKGHTDGWVCFDIATTHYSANNYKKTIEYCNIAQNKFRKRTDDGIGRKKAKEILLMQNRDHRSMATNITHDRLQVLNKKLRQKITLVITDLKDEKGNPAGTKVMIDIPFKN